MQTIQKFLAWFSKQKLGGKLAISAVGLFFFCCLCSVSIGLLSPSKSATPTESAPAANIGPTLPAAPANTAPPIPPTNTPIPTSTPIPTATPDPNLFKPGTYLVGVDIQPGFYKGSAGDGFFGSCYWERLKDLTGSLDAILANDNSVGQFYIEIRSGDYALKTDCAITHLNTLPEHAGEYPQVLSAGTYLVGYDIRPGTYKGQAGTDFTESCYWQRLQNVAGGFDAILANDNATGQFYVQVLPTDFALHTACELTWISE